MYITTPETPLPKTGIVANWECTFFYKEQTVKKCFKCLDSGHIAADCTEQIVCKRCLEPGHKQNECRNETTANDSTKDKDEDTHKSNKDVSANIPSTLATKSTSICQQPCKAKVNSQNSNNNTYKVRTTEDTGGDSCPQSRDVSKRGKDQLVNGKDTPLQPMKSTTTGFYHNNMSSGKNVKT